MDSETIFPEQSKNPQKNKEKNPLNEKMDHPWINPTDPNSDGGCTFPITLLPDEIIEEIFIRLPPKSIHRFKCLSKHWLSYLSSFRFLSAYSSLSPQPPSWILVDKEVRVSPGPSPSISFSLSQPPHISYLTLSGLPTNLNNRGPPTILTSSNGLILFALTPSNLLYIFNPVTSHWAPLPVPDCGKITNLPHVGLSAKYTPTCDDVSLVVIQLQSSRKGATLLTYRSSTGKWGARPASYRVGSETHDPCPDCYAEKTFEVNGKLFWINLSCGLVVLDDPFGEGAELRFIPLPPKVRLDYDTQRFLFGVRGSVHCFSVKLADFSIWRLDMEKGKWGLLHKIDPQKWVGSFHKGVGGARFFSVLHPLDVDLGIFTGKDKVQAIHMREGELVEIVTYPKNAEKKQGTCGLSYMPVVLPTWPTPLPLSLRATSAKENGNLYFKNKNFKEAIVYYSRSISCLPTATAYANRAAANFELGKYQEAELDCSEALKIDQHYVKVYLRRAMVRKELGMFFKAKEDVEVALKLDGQHHEVMKLYAEINCLLEKKL